MSEFTPAQEAIIDGLRARRTDLEPCIPGVQALTEALTRVYKGGGKLLVCGNGGSHADAVHIVGELCKSFERLRPLPSDLHARLLELPLGEALAQHLEAGLPAIALGLNGSLKTAVENDSPLRDMAFAQETQALIKEEDLLIGISTSGNARNCLMAMSVAKAHGAVTASLTGPGGGAMAEAADIAVKAPGDSVKVIQEAHLAIYHTVCALVEAAFFPDPR